MQHILKMSYPKVLAHIFMHCLSIPDIEMQYNPQYEIEMVHLDDLEAGQYNPQYEMAMVH